MEITSENNLLNKENITTTTTTARNILNLNVEEKRKFLNSFDTILCDCDGVIWELYEPIENTGNAINLLKNFGKRIIYVSNNSVRDDEMYKKCFQKSGLEVDLNDVVHPVKSIINYLKKIQFNGLIYCIGTTIFKNTLKLAGYNVIDGPNKILNENFHDLAKNVFDNEPVKAIIIDVDFNLSALKLIRADQYLQKNSDCILIAGATDMKLSFGNNITIIGPGPYSKILEESSGKKAITLGKPGYDLGEFLIEHYGILERKRVLVIGDTIEQDIAFGKKCQFQTLLVLTGSCTREQLNNCHTAGAEEPDYYANSIADFIKLFEDIQEN